MPSIRTFITRLAEPQLLRQMLEKHHIEFDADIFLESPAAIEDTIGRAHHYGAIARDALALFPDSKLKSALAETVDFCIARTH